MPSIVNVPIRAYSGASSEGPVSEWLAQADAALLAAGLDATRETDADKKAAIERRAAAAVLGGLTGPALKAVLTIAETDRKSPAVVFALLRDVFGQPSDLGRSDAYGALAGLVRRPTWSVSETYAEVLAACHRANPSMAQEEKIIHLLRVLGPTGAQVRAHHGFPASLAAAVSAARNLEETGATRGGGATTPARATVVQPWAQPAPVPTDDHWRATLRTEIAAALATMRPPAIAAATGPGTARTDASMTARTRPMRRGPNEFRDGVPVCNRCRELGHIARECPRKGFLPPA